MAFRTRRQHRYEVLRDSGFLKFESRELSRVAFRVPYMRGLIRERNKRLEGALKRGVKRAEWTRQIKTEYFDNRWMKMGRRRKPVYDVWKMLRDFENEYRLRHPEYVSPWEKKRRDFTDVMEKIEKAYEKPMAGGRGRSRSIERGRDEMNQKIIRAIAEGDQKLRRELERERNRRFGY